MNWVAVNIIRMEGAQHEQPRESKKDNYGEQGCQDLGIIVALQPNPNKDDEEDMMNVVSV